MGGRIEIRLTCSETDDIFSRSFQITGFLADGNGG